MNGLVRVITAAGVLIGVSSIANAQHGAKAMFYADDGRTVMPSAPPSQSQPPHGTPAPAKISPAGGPAVRPPSLGIKYWIELVGNDSRRTEVTPDRVFQTGDRIKLRLETNQDGYLYLLNVGSTGRHHLLFPHAEQAGGTNFVKARTVYDVPVGASIRFDDNPGEETLWVLLSPNPMNEPPPRPNSRTLTINPEDGMRLIKAAYHRGAKDLTVEVDAAGPEPRAYAAAALSSLGDDGILALEIKLRHR